MGDHQPEFSYYQIGGFRPNLSLQGALQYDMHKLAQAIFGSESSVELVLGIRPSGASSILISSSQWVKKEGFHHPGTPQPASNFLSLSPLKFNNAFQLARKLSALKPKGKRRGEDDSATNKAYLGQVGQSGQFRSAFEHNRLLFHTSKPSSSFWKFGLSRSSPWASAQLISLFFNEWSHEKGVLLDIGWSSMTCGTYPPTFGTSVHLEIEEKQRFGNRGKQRAVRARRTRALQLANLDFAQAFKHGQTEVLKLSNVAARVQDLLRCDRPLILLVHDESNVRTVLGDLGVDTSDFSSGLESLLRPEFRGTFCSQSTFRDSRRRSRSPRRGQASRDQLRRTPPRTPLSVSLVDVRQMYITLRTRYTDSSASLVAIATELGIQADDRNICAGNESRLLAAMWSSMASGPAIDEQYEARWGVNAVAIRPAAGGSLAELAPPLDPGDVTFDPNDLAPVSSITEGQTRRRVQMMEWDDLDDEEEEFYDR
ncbi:hypothetical protein F5148DRAFT_120411 [Russula earlei]|uniref:Uncharacterized protein n=1 Tax=Russula earlei TaxID=71964 RepID=A0ACC0U6P7_9AGAM|nr:hypothetical protein F5148DRAFT_120411 [Russula earlei]